MEATPNNADLSTKKLGAPYKVLGTPNVRHSKHAVVCAEQVRFGEYVRGLMQEASSLREFARNCGLSAPSISGIISGDTKEIKADTILALAKGSGRRPEVILAAYSGKSLEVSAKGELSQDESRLLDNFRGIPLERRTDLLGYSDMLFKLYGSNGDGASKVGKNGPKPGKVYDAVAGIPKAARRGGKKSSKKSDK